MSDFIDDYLSRADRNDVRNVIRSQGSAVRELQRRSLNVDALSQITPTVGTRLDTLGHIGVTKLNRLLLFSTLATPVITVPPDALTGDNVFEVVLTGQFYQNTGSSQTITPRFYIGLSGSETLVTSDTALSVSSGTTRKAFEYRVRVTAAPEGGTKVQVDEKFDLENATAGQINTIMRTTRTTVIDITTLSDIDSCFIRIANGATATQFRIYTNTLSVQVLDAVGADQIHWYTQPVGSGIDTHIWNTNPTTNYSSQTTMIIGESNGGANWVLRSLTKFSDLDNFLTDPNLSGFQCSEAYLYIHLSADLANNAATMQAFRLLVDFDASQATWNVRKSATNWGTAGGGSGVDYYATALGSLSLTSGETLNVVKSISLDAAEIQKIIDGTYPNYGFLLKTQSESDDAYSIHKANSTIDAYAPMLYLIGTKPN